MGRAQGRVGWFSAGVVRRAVMATAAIALVVGCGGSSDDSEDSAGSDGGAPGGSGGGRGDGNDVSEGSDATADLVDLLPEDAQQVAAVDVAAVRQGLGLPDDQGTDEMSDETVRQLAAALSTPIPFIGNPRPSPIREAFDTGAMTAAASVPYAFAPQRAVVVVRTSQPFDELAAALEGQGYARDGDLLVTDRSVTEMGGATVVTAAGDDLIVLAQSPEVARAVAAGEGDGPALAEQLDAVDGPLRYAVAVADDHSCVETVAAGWQVDPAEGEIVITAAGPDDADGLELLPGDDPISRSVDLEPPQVDGSTIVAGYRYDGPGSPLNPVAAALPGSLFRCP